MTRLLAFLMLLAPAAAAEPLPWLYDVARVAADDVLNVRDAPDAAAPVIGTLAPDARGIEVVAGDATGGWGQINTGERAGWVALRYLDPEAGVWQPGGLPAGLACSGTEPFWSLRPGDGQAVFATPEGGDRTFELAAALDRGIEDDPRRALVAVRSGTRLTAAITPASCSDGMSDRAYGLEILLILEDAGPARLLNGCCSIAAGE
jgi:uncharacterized membrane protein